jgi:serine/threonine protein kinase
VLQDCLEGGGGKGSAGGKGKQETPSWLMEPGEKRKVEPEREEMNWENAIFKQEKPTTAGKTGFGWRRGKSEAVEVEAEREAVNGVLVMRMGDLEIGEQISMGGFSTIHKGRYFELEVAVKKVFNPNISPELLDEFNNEVGMLAKYRHPNIVLMVGAITTPPTLCLAMELVKEGTLYDLIHKRKTPLTDSDRKKIALQLVGVICYLHRHGIVHRDIKSHNILIDRNFTIKLCDFGLARHKVPLPQPRPNSTAAPVSSAALPPTWRRNSSKSGPTPKQSTSSPWERCCTNSTREKCPTTDWTPPTSRTES